MLRFKKYKKPPYIILTIKKYRTLSKVYLIFLNPNVVTIIINIRINLKIFNTIKFKLIKKVNILNEAIIPPNNILFTLIFLFNTSDTVKSINVSNKKLSIIMLSIYTFNFITKNIIKKTT